MSINSVSCVDTQSFIYTIKYLDNRYGKTRHNHHWFGSIACTKFQNPPYDTHSVRLWIIMLCQPRSFQTTIDSIKSCQLYWPLSQSLGLRLDCSSLSFWLCTCNTYMLKSHIIFFSSSNFLVKCFCLSIASTDYYQMCLFLSRYMIPINGCVETFLTIKEFRYFGFCNSCLNVFFFVAFFCFFKKPKIDLVFKAYNF